MQLLETDHLNFFFYVVLLKKIHQKASLNLCVCQLSQTHLYSCRGWLQLFTKQQRNILSLLVNCVCSIMSKIQSKLSMINLCNSSHCRIEGRVKETQSGWQTTLRVRRCLRAQKELLLEKGSIGKALLSLRPQHANYDISVLSLHRPKAWRDPERTAKHCWSNRQSISPPLLTL